MDAGIISIYEEDAMMSYEDGGESSHSDEYEMLLRRAGWMTGNIEEERIDPMYEALDILGDGSPVYLGDGIYLESGCDVSNWDDIIDAYETFDTSEMKKMLYQNYKKK